MKNLSLVLIFLFVAGITFHGNAQKPKGKGKLVLTYTIQSVNGNNGGGIIYNPQKGLYYVAFAGNSTYPLEVFDQKGKPIKQLETGYDVRGFWLNEKNNRIEGNSYSGTGIFYKKLDSNGYPEESTETILSDIDMPTPQSAGTYNSASDVIAYFYEGVILTYRPEDHAYLGTVWLNYSDISNLSSYSIFYTGITGMEYCLFDVVKKCVVFVDKESGKEQATTKIPYKSTPEEVFNCGYANGIFWIYSKEKRKWFGYKVI